MITISVGLKTTSRGSPAQSSLLQDKDEDGWSLQVSTICGNHLLILRSSARVEFLIYSGCSPWIYSNSTYWVPFSARNSEKLSIPTSHVQQREYRARWPSSPSFCCVALSPIGFLVEEPSLDWWHIFFISPTSSKLISSFHIDGAIDPPHFYHSHDEIEAALRAAGVSSRPYTRGWRK